jgi:hypothetical protein
MPEFIKDLSFRRLLDSLKLTPKHRLVEFGGTQLLFFINYLPLINLVFNLDIWAEIFLWCFMTSIVVHLIATIVAVLSLKSHKIGRWYAVLIILAGIITPIVPSALTSKICLWKNRKIFLIMFFSRCTSFSYILCCISGNKTILLFRTWYWTNWCYTFFLLPENFVYIMIIII